MNAGRRWEGWKVGRLKGWCNRLCVIIPGFVLLSWLMKLSFLRERRKKVGRWEGGKTEGVYCLASIVFVISRLETKKVGAI